MIDRINDIAWQAHQGSVAAIIQLLNEKLANSGVRTRAIFADGVLQLLCEAPSVEQLDQSILVAQIQQILESTAPRNIHRVNINSRIVREQQLLWLKEIYSDRENQLLWSQEIVLTRPNLVKQIIRNFQEVPPEPGKLNLPEIQFSLPVLLHKKNKNSPKSGMVFVASLILLLLLGWVIYTHFGEKLKSLMQLETSKPVTPVGTSQSNEKVKSSSTNKNLSAISEDPFVASVRIANQAATFGKVATTSTQWLELAAKWQRASDLMNMVPPDHSRYQEAKIRTQLYKKYSEEAQKQAQKVP